MELEDGIKVYDNSVLETLLLPIYWQTYSVGPALSDAIEKFDSYSEFCESLIRRKMTLGLLYKVPLLSVTTAIGGIDLAVTVCFRVSHETRLLFSAGKFVLRANLREMPNLIRIFMYELWQTGFEAVSVGVIYRVWYLMGICHHTILFIQAKRGELLP